MLLELLKFTLIVFSAISTFLSLVFMFSPALFSKIEEAVSISLGTKNSFNAALEGEINFFNDWVKRNRFLFGPLLVILAAINTRNAFFF